MNAVHPMQTGLNQKQDKRKQQQGPRKKANPLKEMKVVDYLEPKYLGRFTNDQGKILPRRITGVTAYQQRRIANAVKYARHLALIPFVAQDIS